MVVLTELCVVPWWNCDVLPLFDCDPALVILTVVLLCSVQVWSVIFCWLWCSALFDCDICTLFVLTLTFYFVWLWCCSNSVWVGCTPWSLFDCHVPLCWTVVFSCYCDVPAALFEWAVPLDLCLTAIVWLPCTTLLDCGIPPWLWCFILYDCGVPHCLTVMFNSICLNVTPHFVALWCRGVWVVCSPCVCLHLFHCQCYASFWLWCFTWTLMSKVLANSGFHSVCLWWLWWPTLTLMSKVHSNSDFHSVCLWCPTLTLMSKVLSNSGFHSVCLWWLWCPTLTLMSKILSNSGFHSVCLWWLWCFIVFDCDDCNAPCYVTVPVCSVWLWWSIVWLL